MTTDTIAPWAELAPFTVEQLLALPDDAWRYELVEGRLIRMPPTSLQHGDLEVAFAAALRQFARTSDLGLVVAGETGFLISAPGEPDTLLAPDVAFIRRERVPSPDSRDWKGFPRLCPDLVVEIGSPSQGRPELGAKASLWLAHGARLVWVVWPNYREVDVWHQRDRLAPQIVTVDDELDGDDVLLGFSLPLTNLFP